MTRRRPWTHRKPMDDEPPVLPQRAVIPIYPRWEPGIHPPSRVTHIPRGYGPPGSQGPSRLFAAAIGSGGVGPSDVPQVPVQPPGKPQPPSGPPPSGPPLPPAGPPRWAPPRYPPPPGPPDPPAPWVLDAANLGPWASLKPEMVKVPDDFNGDSNDIARFFSQCDMYFSIFNQHFYYHPHKVIFCASRFKKEAQVWWGVMRSRIRKGRSRLSTLSGLRAICRGSQAKILEGCQCRDQVRSVGRTPTKQLPWRRPVLPAIWIPRLRSGASSALT